jgi:cytochrome oxidase Cu insertion factor (SCO1/SenC/PrrC family)
MLKRSWIGVSVIVAVFTSLIVTAAWAQPADERPARPTRGGNSGRKPVRPQVGEVLKDFTLKDTKGKDVTLSDFSKKKQIFVLELGACT